MKWKYEIEETVQLKVAPHVKIFILERHIQDCSAGVQYSYYGRPGMEFGGILNQSHFREIELEKIPKKSKAGGTE